MIPVVPCRVKGHAFLLFKISLFMPIDKSKVVKTVLDEMTLAISEPLSCTKHQKSADKQWQVQTYFRIGQRG